SGKAAPGNFGIVDRLGEPGGNGAVINSGAGIGLGGQLLAQGEGHAAGFADGCQDFGVIGRIDDDGHIGMVLGGGADHGRAADVDILDDVVIGRARGDGFLEGIEVDGDEVDGADFVLDHGGSVV